MAKVKLTAKEKAELKEAAKKMAMDEFDIKEKDVQLLEAAMEEAKMPVTLKDEDFKLGERELDIRGLSKENKEQMMFRMAVLNVVYQRQITQSLVDVQRLLMLVLKKLGVEDIIGELDDLLEKVKSQVKEKTN